MHSMTDNSCLYVQASNNRPGSLSRVDLSKITQDTGSRKLGARVESKKIELKTPNQHRNPCGWVRLRQGHPPGILGEHRHTSIMLLQALLYRDADCAYYYTDSTSW